MSILIFIAAAFRPVSAEKRGHVRAGYKFVAFWLHSEHTQSERHLSLVFSQFKRRKNISSVRLTITDAYSVGVHN